MFNGFKDPSNCYGSQPLYENCNQATFLPCDGTKQGAPAPWDYAASQSYNGMAPFYGEQALSHHPHSRLGSALLHGGGPPMPPPAQHSVSHDRKGGGGGGAANAAEAGNMLIQHYNNGAAVAGAAVAGPHHASVVRPTAVINCQSRRSGPCCSNHPGRVPQSAPSVSWGSTATPAPPPPHGTPSDAPGVVQRYLNEAGAPPQSFLHDEAARFRPPPDFASLSKLTRYAPRDNTSDAAADPVAAKTALKSLEACALRPVAGGSGAQVDGGTGVATAPKRDATGNRGSCRLYEGAPPALAELTPVVPDAAMDVQGDPSGLLCYSGTSCVPPPHPQWPPAARSQSDAAAAWLHPAAAGAWGDPTWPERNGGGGYPEYARYHHAPPPYHQPTQHIPQQAQHRKVAHHEATAVAGARLRTTGSARRQPDAYVSYGGVAHGAGGAPKGMEPFTTGIAQPPTRFSPHMTYTQSKISRTANEALMGAAHQYDGSFSYGAGYTGERLAPTANATGVYPGAALNMTRKSAAPALQQHSQSLTRVSDVIRFGANGVEPFPGGGGAGAYGAGSYAGLQAGCARLVDEGTYAPPSMQQMLDFAASASLSGSQRHLQNHALPPVSRPGTLFQTSQPQHAPPSHSSHMVGAMQQDGCMYARPPLPAARAYTPAAAPAPPAPERKPKQRSRVLDVRHFLATWDEESEDLAPTPAPPPVYDVEDCTPATPANPPTPAPALITVTDEPTIPASVGMTVEQAPSMPDISPPHEAQVPETISEVQEVTEDLLKELMAVARPRTPSTVIVQAAEAAPSSSSPPPPPLLPAAAAASSAFATSSAPPTRATSAPPPPPTTAAHSPAAARAASAPFVSVFTPEEEYFRLRDLTGLVSSSSDSESDEEPEPRTSSGGVSVIQHGGPSRAASPLVDATLLGLTAVYNSNCRSEHISEGTEGNADVTSVKSCGLDSLQSPSSPAPTPPYASVPSSNLPDVVPCPPEGISVSDGGKKDHTSGPKTTTQEKKCVSEEGLSANLPEIVAPEANEVSIENLIDNTTKFSTLFCPERRVESNSSPREHKTLSPVVIDQNGNYSPKFPQIDTKVNSYQSSEEKSGGREVVEEVESSSWASREQEPMKNTNNQQAQEKTQDRKCGIPVFPEIIVETKCPRSLSPQSLTTLLDLPSLPLSREVIKSTNDISIHYQESQHGVPVDLSSSSSTRTECAQNASESDESDNCREKVVTNIASKESRTVITDGLDVHRNLIREFNSKERIMSSEFTSVLLKGYQGTEPDNSDQIANSSSILSAIAKKEVDASHPNVPKLEMTTISEPIEMTDEEVENSSNKSSEEISIVCDGAKKQGKEEKEINVQMSMDLLEMPSSESDELTSANSNLECVKCSNSSPTKLESYFEKEGGTETSEQFLSKEEMENERADSHSEEESQVLNTIQANESFKDISQKDKKDEIPLEEEYIDEVQHVKEDGDLGVQNVDQGNEECLNINIPENGELMDDVEDDAAILEQSALSLGSEKIEDNRMVAVTEIQGDKETVSDNIDNNSDKVNVEEEIKDSLDKTSVSGNHNKEIQDNQELMDIEMNDHATKNSVESVLLCHECTKSDYVNFCKVEKEEAAPSATDLPAPLLSEPPLPENIEERSIPNDVSAPSLIREERRQWTDEEMPDLELGATNALVTGPPTEMPTLESMALSSSTPPPPLQPLSPSPNVSPCVRSPSPSHSPHHSKTPPSSPMYVESPAGARALEHLRCPSPPSSPGPLSPFASRSCAFKNPSAPSSPLDLRYSSTPRSPPASRSFISKSPCSPQTFVLETPILGSATSLETFQIHRRECASPTDCESPLPLLQDDSKLLSAFPTAEGHFSPKEYSIPKSLNTSDPSTIGSLNSLLPECLSSVSVLPTSVPKTYSESSISKPCSLTSPSRTSESPTFPLDCSPKSPPSNEMNAPSGATEISTFSSGNSPKPPPTYPSKMNALSRPTEISTFPSDRSPKSPPTSLRKMNALSEATEIPSFQSECSPKSPLTMVDKMNSPCRATEIPSCPSDSSPKTPTLSNEMNAPSGSTEIPTFQSNGSPKSPPTLVNELNSPSRASEILTFPSTFSPKSPAALANERNSPSRATEILTFPSSFSPKSPAALANKRNSPSRATEIPTFLADFSSKSPPTLPNKMDEPSGVTEVPTFPSSSSPKPPPISHDKMNSPSESTEIPTFKSDLPPKSPPTSPNKMNSPSRAPETPTFPPEFSPKTPTSPNRMNSPSRGSVTQTFPEDSELPCNSPTSISPVRNSPVLNPVSELSVLESKSGPGLSPRGSSNPLEIGNHDVDCSYESSSNLQPTLVCSNQLVSVSQPSATCEGSKVISVPTSVLVLAPSTQLESTRVSEEVACVKDSQSSEMTEENAISNTSENDRVHADADGTPKETSTVIQEVCVVETAEGETAGPAFTLVGAPEDVAVAACALLEMEDAAVFGDSASEQGSHVVNSVVPANEGSSDVNSKDATPEEETLKGERTEAAVPVDSSAEAVAFSVPASPTTPASTGQSEQPEELVPAPGPPEHDPWSSGFGPQPFVSGGRSPASVEMLPVDSVANWPYPEEEVVCSEASGPEDGSIASVPISDAFAAYTPAPALQRTNSACSRSSGSGSDTSLKCRLSWKKIFALSRGGRGGRGTARRRGRPSKRSRGRRGRPPLLPSLSPAASPSMSSPLHPPPDEPGGDRSRAGFELGPTKIEVRLGSNAVTSQAWQVVDAAGSAALGAAGRAADRSPGVTKVVMRRLVLRCDRPDAPESAGAAAVSSRPVASSSCSLSDCEDEGGTSAASVTPMPSSSEDEGEAAGAASAEVLSTANETCAVATWVATTLTTTGVTTTTRAVATPVMTPLVSPASKSPSSSSGETATPRTPRILIRRSGGDEYRSFLRGEEARWQPVVVIPRSIVLDQVARKLAARPLSIRLRFASANPIPPQKPPSPTHETPPVQHSEASSPHVAAAPSLAAAPDAAEDLSSSAAAAVVTSAPSCPSRPVDDGASSFALATKDLFEETKDSFSKREAAAAATSSRPLKKERRRRSWDPANSAPRGGRKRASEGDCEPALAAAAGVVAAALLPAKRRCSEPAPPLLHCRSPLPVCAAAAAAAVPDDDDSGDGGAVVGAEVEDAASGGGGGDDKCAACEHIFPPDAAGDRAAHVRQHRYHCQRCDLAFRSQAEFVAHVGARHPSTRERHHCLLCARSYASAERHALHVRGRLHRALEGLQRRTVHALFSLLTGHACPGIVALDAAERAALRWLPAEPGDVHFYHQATPLQMAIQDWTRRQQTEVASAPPVPLGEAEAL